MKLNPSSKTAGVKATGAAKINEEAHSGNAEGMKCPDTIDETGNAFHPVQTPLKSLSTKRQARSRDDERPEEEVASEGCFRGNNENGPINAATIALLTYADVTFPGGRDALLDDLAGLLAERKYFSARSVAKMLDVSTAAVKVWRSKGLLNASLKIPGGTVRYTLADINSFLRTVGKKRYSRIISQQGAAEELEL